MENLISIKGNDTLYDNYKNYLYEVNNTDFLINNDEKKYILFNPSIHYWVCLDDISAEIYRQIHCNNSIELVKKNLIDKYSISESIYEEDALPIIEQFVKNEFFVWEDKPKVASWMEKKVNVDEISSYPFNEIYISLSDECNLNCIYCFNKEDRKRRLKNKLNFKLPKQRIIEVLKEFKELKGTGVVFTGGEPTLNNDLLELCKVSKEIGLNPHFITNGTLLNRLDFEKLFEFVDTFGISLDSVVQEEIEKLWGNSSISIEGNIFRSLEKINEVAGKKGNIQINIMPIVSSLNINSLKKLVAIVDEKLSNCNVNWQMTRYSPINNEKVDELLSVREEDYIFSVSESLKATYLNKKTEKNMSKSVSEINNEINAFAFSNSGKLIPEKAPKVLICAPSYFIANNGDVYPCQGFEKEEFKLGNIINNSLTSLFEEDPFKEIRKRIIVNDIENCKNCELKFVCANKCAGCVTSCDKDMEKCKINTIQRLFLQTQLS